MNIGAPEVIWFCLAGLSLLGAMFLDGEPKRGNHSLSTALLSVGLSFGLLWWGGFFA